MFKIKKIQILVYCIWIFVFLIPEYVFSQCVFSISSTKNKFELKGNWNFFKGGGKVAANPELDISTWKLIQIPFRWYQIKELKNYKGEIWLRCNIIIKEIPEEMLLDLGYLREIDEVYWNGTLIGATGNFEKKIPDFSERRIYYIPPESIQEVNVLAIRLYGSFWFSGIPDVPIIHFSSHILRQKINFEFLSFVFSITYILSSIFFIIYGFFTQEKKVNFYFALFSIFLGLYNMILWGQRYIFFQDFILSYIVELLLLFPLPYFFLSFILEWLKIEDFPYQQWTKYTTILLMILAIIGYFIPQIYQTSYLHIVTYINLLNIIFILFFIIKIIIKYTKQKKEEIKYINWGLFFLIPFLFNDILVTLDIIHTPRLFVFSFPVFLLAVAFSISEKALKLKQESLIKSDELRQMEKQKLNVIYNISNKFQSIFDELKQNIILKKNIDSAIIRLNYFIESAQILDYLEKKTYNLQPSKINLYEETTKIIEDTVKSTKQKKNRLQIQLPDKNTTFWMDLPLYKMVVYHLLENALYYSEDDVEFSIKLEDSILKIKVLNKGKGIPEEFQSKIFNKYSRGNTKIPGSGIGLYLVYEITNLLMGHIQFESRQEFYTWFEVQLPELKEIL